MQIMAAVLLLSLLIPAVVVGSKPNYCDEKNVDPSIFTFTLIPSSAVYVCPSRAKDLHCCVQGYSTIVWEQFDDATKKFVDVLQLRHLPNEQYTSDDNQTFTMRAVVDGRDNGIYRCVVHPLDSQNFQPMIHETELRVSSYCENWNRDPLVQLPPPPNHTIAKNIGDPFEYTCRGWFGPKTACKIGCSAAWSVIPPGGVLEDIFFDPSERIWRNASAEEEESTYSSDLHIESVTKEDFHKIFRCQLVQVDRYAFADVILTEIAPPPGASHLLLYFLLALLLLLIPTSLAVFYLWLDLQIIYKKYMSHMHGENLIIIHAMADYNSFAYDFGKQLAKKLRVTVCHIDERADVEEDSSSSILVFVISRHFWVAPSLAELLYKCVQNDNPNRLFVALEPTDIQLPLGVVDLSPGDVQQAIQESAHVTRPFDCSESQEEEFLKECISLLKRIKYDAVLVYCSQVERDKLFGEELCSHLASDKMGFRVFSEQLVLPHERPVDQYARAKNNARVIVFVISKSFFSPGDHLHCLDHTCPDQYRRMVFILLDPISKAFMDNIFIAEATKKSITHGRKIHWPLHEEQWGDFDWDQKKDVQTFLKRLRLSLPPPIEPISSSAQRHETPCSVSSWADPMRSEDGIKPDERLLVQLYKV